MSKWNPRANEIFARAILCESAEDRDAFIQDSCREDSDLLATVSILLRAHFQAGSFLSADALSSDFLPGAESSIPTITTVNRSNSVVASLRKNTPWLKQVALKESSREGRVTKLASKELPDSTADLRYELHGEIARGGMGVIIKGRDADLGRDLAIKVLLDAHREKPEIIERFVEEAQIGGQLQHPGIVPIYELGQFTDERPFFSMKLIKGKTLASLLAEREAPSDDQTRMLGIFEQVCQTMAYAHSRGVIHRDLKPANIMVGAFGEVQVMDWGLAKVLEEGGVADEKKSLNKHKDVSVIRTRRSTGSDLPNEIGSQTRIGSVMGTPAYMPPEQALGETDRLDERTDVFGLGAVLCEILSGKPPYVGNDGDDVFRQASRGKLDDCWARLDASGAEQGLIAIVKRSLALEPEQRWRNAGALADAMSDYLNGVQERLKQAEITKSQAQARAEEEGRRRKLYAVITALVLLMAGAIALFANHQRQLQQEARQARDEAQEKSEQLEEQLQISTVNRLAAQSGSLRETDPVLSVLVAVEAQKASERAGRASTIALETLMNATSRLGGRVHNAHDAPIRRRAMSSGRLMATGDQDGRICLWDVFADDPQETVQILDVHRARIEAMKFTPDDRWLVTGSQDGDLRRWDLLASQVADAGQRLIGHTEMIRSIDISGDGRWLITASHDTTARLWDLEQADPGKTVRKLDHPSYVDYADFILGDRWVVTSNWGGRHGYQRKCWDLEDVLNSDSETVSPKFVLDSKKGALLGSVLGFSNDGRWMLTGSGIWQLHEDRAPTRLQTFDAGSKSGWSMRFLLNDQFLVTGGSGRKVKLWKWLGNGLGEVLQEFEKGSPRNFSSDAKWVLQRGELFDLEDESKPPIRIGDPVATTGRATGVAAGVYSADGRRLITPNVDGGIRIWNLDDDLFTSPVINHGLGRAGQSPFFTIGPGGSSFAIMNNRGGVRLARFDAGEFTDLITLEGPNSSVRGRAFSPDGSWFAAGNKGCVQLCDLNAEDPSSAVITLTGFEGVVSSVSFGPNSNVMATGCLAGSIRLWDLSSRNAHQIRQSEELLLEANEERELHKECLTISPDGRWLASGDSQSTVRMWDLQDPARKARSWQRTPSLGGEPHDKWISSVAFTQSGAWLVTVGHDFKLQLWRVTGQGLEGKPTITRDISGAGTWPKILFSPNGRSIFFHRGGGSVQQWTLTDSGLSETPTVFGESVPGAPVDPAISPDGRWLFSGVREQIQRWDLTAENPTEESIVLRTENVHGMIVSGDGRYLVTTDPNRLQLWPLDTEELLKLARERTGRSLTSAERRRYLE